MSDNLKAKTVRGLKWTTVESAAQQVFQVVLGITMARLLNVEDFGTIAVLSIFIALANIFQESGFGVALYRENDVSDKTYSSVLYFNVFVSACLYVILYFSVHLISDFQKEPIPIDLARFMFLTFFVSSFGLVPYVMLTKKVDYRSVAYANIIALSISGIVSILMAFYGFGVWAICTQGVLYHSIRIAGLWYFCAWKPLWYFSFAPLKKMLAFSSKIMVTYSLNTIANNITPNLIEKHFGLVDAGLYSQASKWYNKPVLFVTSPIGAVSMPVISSVNNDLERQKRVFRKLIKTVAFISFPSSFFFALVANEFVLLILKEKWLEVVPYMQLLSLGAIFAPLELMLIYLLNSRGKSGALFVFTLLKNICIMLSLFFSIKYGIITLIISLGLVNYIFFTVESIFCIRLLACRVSEYSKDILPYFFTSLFLGLVFHHFTLPISNQYMLLVVKFTLPFSLYLSAMYLGKSEVLNEGVGFLLRFARRKIK
ncbi:lipopolysaccharide biosynthesis protein [Bacteroidales bacterium]|nr:lipopolysaccharide biosynthesis protein [Bacteroidales bacterium]